MVGVPRPRDRVHRVHVGLRLLLRLRRRHQPDRGPRVVGAGRSDMRRGEAATARSRRLPDASTRSVPMRSPQRADIVEQANVIVGDDGGDAPSSTPPIGQEAEQVIPRLARRLPRPIWPIGSRTSPDFAPATVRCSPRPRSTARRSANFIGDVARQNEMPTCQVPLDLANCDSTQPRVAVSRPRGSCRRTTLRR